ncbi:MAG: DUF11 domain-containing protein [Alkalinema sp. RU_4_3]|nr:DUF11 domain-containing protein [Alkalinema sp. RU_4_3]
MKRTSIFTLSLIATIAISTLASQPGIASLQNLGNMISQAVQQKAQVELSLSVAKQVKQDDKVTWQESGDRVTAQPSDVLRYSLKSQNKGNKAVKNLVMTQPIPAGMSYVLKSTTQPAANVTYSIDGGKSFVASPMVAVKLANGQIEQRPAPATAYTHVRWQLNEAIAPGQSAKVSYQVVVR